MGNHDHYKASGLTFAPMLKHQHILFHFFFYLIVFHFEIDVYLLSSNGFLIRLLINELLACLEVGTHLVEHSLDLRTRI